MEPVPDQITLFLSFITEPIKPIYCLNQFDLGFLLLLYRSILNTPVYFRGTPDALKTFCFFWSHWGSENSERLFKSYLLCIPHNHFFYIVMLPPTAIPRRGGIVLPFSYISQSYLLGRWGVNLYLIPRTQSGGKSGLHDLLNKKALTSSTPIFTSFPILRLPFLPGEGEWAVVCSLLILYLQIICLSFGSFSFPWLNCWRYGEVRAKA